MDSTLVSILMPIKNATPYLSICINSILDQTYNNWELIAVNDHSSDGTYECLSKFADQDNRIKVLNNNGSGIIDALRLAYSNSKGDLISRMDADDLMTPNKLENLKKILIKFGKGHIATGQVKYFSENTLGNGYKKYEEWLNKLISSGNNFSEIYKECVIPSPCWMVYREDFDNCNAFNNVIYPEDYDLCFRFYEKQLICIPNNEILHYWRDYETRSSRTSDHYADNRFLDLKVHYFLKLDFNKERPLVVWGAGKKGKAICKLLSNKNISFHWACNNPKKIGKEIYNTKLISSEDAIRLINPQFIIAVANPEEQNQLKEYFKDKSMLAQKDYFFFC